MSDDALPLLFALIWRADAEDEAFDDDAFQSRVPRLMAWLKELRAAGCLVACGGGGFANHQGGLTIVKADSAEEALALAEASPMNEIGSTQLFGWHPYFAELSVPRDM